MIKGKIPDSNSYFWSLEARYKRFTLQKIKTYLNNAGYKGKAFMFMFTFQQLLFKVYKNTPMLDQIIASFEGSFLFDKRMAVSQVDIPLHSTPRFRGIVLH